MIIAMIERATRIVGKSQGYLGLPIRDEVVIDSTNGVQTPSMVTAWTPTPDELERLAAGANVTVRILGTLPPPMLVEVGKVPNAQL